MWRYAQNKSVVCSGSRVTNSAVKKLHGSDNRGGIIVKNVQRALAHTCVAFTLLFLKLQKLYYQCTIIIFIATTTNHTIRTLSKSSSFMIHGIYFACAHCLTHYNDKQEQYLRLQQIITSVLVIRINCRAAQVQQNQTLPALGGHFISWCRGTND